jgi:hypothetical protein
MLGRHIIPDEHGTVIGVRVLPIDELGPQLEITFQTSGTVLGTPFQNTGTVVSSLRPSGTLHADGQGIATGEHGEILTWTFHGTGMPTGPGMAARFRGSVRFETSAQNLAELNQICAVVEAETDAERHMTAQLWEWQ